MPISDQPTSDESQPQTINSLNILKEAIRQIPPLKYALGVVGIAAALAIIKMLITDLRVAVFGIILLLVLMTVLFIFAKLTAIAAKATKLPALTLLWFSLLFAMVTASFLFTSVFFDWPINLKYIVAGGGVSVGEQSPKSATTPAKSTYLRGIVRDFRTKQGIGGAIVEVELLPGKTFTTASDGGFSVENISADPGDSARILVRKERYSQRDEYVTLPGPKTIYLERSK